MIKRDEFIQKLKRDRERLNAGCQRQLTVLHERRKRALLKLREVQSSSAGAWQDMAQGADAAWQQMRAAFAQARARFERHPAGPKD